MSSASIKQYQPPAQRKQGGWAMPFQNQATVKTSWSPKGIDILLTQGKIFLGWPGNSMHLPSLNNHSYLPHNSMSLDAYPGYSGPKDMRFVEASPQAANFLIWLWTGKFEPADSSGCSNPLLPILWLGLERLAPAFGVPRPLRSSQRAKESFRPC